MIPEQSSEENLINFLDAYDNYLKGLGNYDIYKNGDYFPMSISESFLNDCKYWKFGKQNKKGEMRKMDKEAMLKQLTDDLNSKTTVDLIKEYNDNDINFRLEFKMSKEYLKKFGIPNDDKTYILIRVKKDRFIAVWEFYDEEEGYTCVEYSLKDVITNLEKGIFVIVK